MFAKFKSLCIFGQSVINCKVPRLPSLTTTKGSIIVGEKYHCNNLRLISIGYVILVHLIQTHCDIGNTAIEGGIECCCEEEYRLL
jgi:hypothetical protein